MFLSFFLPTASLSTVLPYMENPPGGERARDAASASAASLGWLRCVTKEREWETGGGRSEDQRSGSGMVQRPAVTPPVSQSEDRENGGATVSGMLGGGDDISISSIHDTNQREGGELETNIDGNRRQEGCSDRKTEI